MDMGYIPHEFSGGGGGGEGGAALARQLQDGRIQLLERRVAFLESQVDRLLAAGRQQQVAAAGNNMNGARGEAAPPLLLQPITGEDLPPQHRVATSPPRFAKRSGHGKRGAAA